MKRVWLCIGILGAIICLSAGWLACLYDRTKEMSRLIDNCVTLAENDSEDTREAISELCDYWESFYGIASLFENSLALNSISDSVSKLMPLYEKDNDELFSECEMIKVACDRIFRSNMPFVSDAIAD